MSTRPIGPVGRLLSYVDAIPQSSPDLLVRIALIPADWRDIAVILRGHAAPDLLTALEQIDLADLQHGDNAMNEIHRIARAAIGQAKGGASS